MIVRGIDAVVIEKDEQPLEMDEQRRGKIAHVPIPVVEMGFRQSEQLPLQGEGFRDELSTIDRASSSVAHISSEAMPQAKQARPQ